MFVPVGCAECGKLFQVERGQLGQSASCPWCGARVLALPVAAAAEPQPLPLPLPEEVPVVRPQRSRPAPRLRVLPRLALAALCGFLALATFAVQRYRNGGFASLALESFVAPDGSCRATLPGSAEPAPPPDAPFTPIQTGFTAYSAKSWFSRAKGGVGWIGLDPERARLARSEDLLVNVRDGLGRWLGEPAIEKEGVVKSGSADGSEVRFGAIGGPRFTARMIAVLDSPTPRVYFIWVGGTNIDPDGEAAARVLSSFRLTAAGK